MERHPWLERAAAELARRGVPAGYQARLLAELGDHIHDLTEEGTMATEERLGDPAAVAAAAAERCPGGWVRRHPVLVFGLAPVPAAFGVMVAVLFGVGLFRCAARELTGALESEVAGIAVVAAYDLSVRFGCAAATVAVFAGLAARPGIGRRWPAVAAVQLAVFAGCWATSPNYGGAPYVPDFGFTFLPLCSRGWVVRCLSCGQVIQAAVPLLVGAVLFARYRRSAGPVAIV